MLPLPSDFPNNIKSLPSRKDGNKQLNARERQTYVLDVNNRLPKDLDSKVWGRKNSFWVQGRTDLTSWRCKLYTLGDGEVVCWPLQRGKENEKDNSHRPAYQLLPSSL